MDAAILTPEVDTRDEEIAILSRALEEISAMMRGDKSASGNWYPVYTGTLRDAVVIARTALAETEKFYADETGTQKA